MSLEYALAADITVHEVEYEHGEGTVEYEVHEDAEGDHRAVVGIAYGADGNKLDYEIDGVRLYPNRWERLRERFTDWTYEPPLEYEQVFAVTEVLEQAIDEQKQARSRHESCELEGERPN